MDKMWLQMVVAVLALLTITNGEIFDVTTIFDLSSDPSGDTVVGRVHARTNALGLKLRNEGEELLVTDDQKLNLTCDLSIYGNCSWDYGSEWTLARHTFEELKSGEKYNMKNKPIYIDFENVDNMPRDEDVIIYVESSLFSTENSVLLRFFHSNYVDYYLDIYTTCNLGIPFGHSIVTMNKGESITIFCRGHSDQFYLGSNLNSTHISFTFEDGIFKVLKDEQLLRTFDVFDNDDKLHFRYFGYDSNSIKPMLTVPMLSANTNMTEMTSPLVMLNDTDKLCLTLVIQCPQYTEQDVLLLLAEDIYHNQHILLTVNNVKTGVNVLQNCFNVEDMFRPAKLILRNLMGISIIRISTYSPEGEEFWTLESVNKTLLIDPSSKRWISTSQTILYGVDFTGVTHKAISTNLTNLCQNGGVMIDNECSCPPGYSGTECQIACGPNGFGLDCGGMCSLQSEMCKNLLMCNSHTGCHCSPGFKGIKCDQYCEPGSYGNDCEQTCGNCLYGKPCDIYTGKCQSCESGYVPPYCKKAYVYYATKPKLNSLDYGIITVKFNPWDTAGVGSPKFYQIQYREKGTSDWYIYISKNIRTHDIYIEESTEILEEKIKGLKTGHFYEVRVVFMDANFNKYDGDMIQAQEIVTKCDVPLTYDYKMKTKITAPFITVSWSYINETEYWCPVEYYEVSWGEGWKQKESRSTGKDFVMHNILPNISFKFKIRAKTSGGYAPYSEITVSTKYQGSSEVRDLKVVSAYSTSAQISWNPPKEDNSNLLYRLTYKCVQQPACKPGCVNATEGALTVDKTSFTLSPLLPFAQYQVTVTPEGGLESSIYFGTDKTAPTEVPKPSVQAPIRTNTSLTVFWDAVPVCSSYLLGYNYHLLKESESTKILDSGFTETTNASFCNLTASTKYRVRVFVMTIADWNPDVFLEITSSTSATVPNAVGNLTVYKKGRNMLGLRWAAPQFIYGLLNSFTISYALGTKEFSQIVEPTPCVPWPQLYCHTLEGLRANQKYNISVSARNTEVAEDGDKAFVTAITKESTKETSMAPEGVKLINSTSTSISVEWHYPNMTNGIVRSFIISVEETDQFMQDNCCQVYPLIEILVQEEQLSYNSEVSGLHPASTYFVSVSAKTIGLGSPLGIVVHTKPPHMPFSILPQLQAYNKGSWLPGENDLQVFNQSEAYLPLIKAHILLIVDQDGNGRSNDSGIFNPQLDTLLYNLISKPFFFYQEYSQDNLQLDVPLTTTPDVDSVWGACPSPSPFKLKDKYQLVAAQVSEYNNEYNIDLRYFSETVTFDL